MKKLPLISALAALLATTGALALTPSEWRFRQSLEIEKTGPVRILLPLETLDKLASDLRDLRLVDSEGRELSCALVTERRSGIPSEGAWRELRLPVEMRLDEARRETVVTIATGTNALVGSVRLQIPDTTDYTVAARLEISNDGREWESLGGGWPLFRRSQAGGFAAVRGDMFTLRKERRAPFIRISMPMGESPIAVTGASVSYWTGGGETPPKPSIMTAPATIAGIDEKPGETVVRLDLGAANLVVKSVTLDVADSLFTRNVLGKWAGSQAEHGATIYRFPVGGGVNAEETSVGFLSQRIPSREIELRVKNKDSAPLRLRGATVSWWPVCLVFNAPGPGRYELLSGNPAAARREYDIEAILKKMENFEVVETKAGPLVETPDYRAPEPPREPWRLAGSALFWIALAVVVIVLLGVVARLLPKPRD